MQLYIGIERIYRRTRNTCWLVFFELLVLCVLFQLFSWFTLRLTPYEAMEPMVACTVTILIALIFCGAYEWSCFKSLPTMYCRVFLGFCLGTVLCTSLANWLVPSIDVFRFEFAFIFVSTIVLTTTRSLICGALTEKNKRNRRQNNRCTSDFETQ